MNGYWVTKMIQAWMIIQFRNTMHRNGVNLAEKKSPFSKFIIEKIPVCNLALLSFHQNISKSFGWNVKARFIYKTIILSVFGLPENSVKMPIMKPKTRQIINRKEKVHQIIDQRL